MAAAGLTNGAYELFQMTGSGTQGEYPQQDSNLRTRLRRPALYPLSYGGRRPPPPGHLAGGSSQAELSLLVLVADGEHQPILHVI